MLKSFIGIPTVESETSPTNASVTSDSISFYFKTDVPMVPGTEQYYKYLVQYCVRDSTEWREDLPLIDHPDGVTVSRRLLRHTINNLEADTEYEVRLSVCRVWYDVRGDCSWARNPVVSIRTGEQALSSGQLYFPVIVMTKHFSHRSPWSNLAF